MPSRPMSGLDGQTIGEFKIVARVGQGAMGTVYLAEQPSLNRAVAIKILNPDLARDEEYSKRFEREGVLAASLNHPNIAQVYAAGEFEGLHYIAMEYVNGESLEHRMLREGRIAPAEALRITSELTSALEHAWQKARMIHRDVKPSNVLISTSGQIKLADFGMAISVVSESTLTATGMLVGTPLYISPEQARCEDDPDFRTDIYSLGCTLYHMLCGRPPFTANAPFAIAIQHVTKPLPPILEVFPECPLPVVRLVNRMVAKKADARPASYAAFRVDLDEAARLLAQEPKKSRRASIVLVSVALAGIALFTVAMFSPLKERWFGTDRGGRAAIDAGADPASEAQPTDPSVAIDPHLQAKQVLQKLKETNEGFDVSTASYRVFEGAVVELYIDIKSVQDVSPIAALSSLKRLRLGRAGQAGTLESLEGLRGLSLQWLECHNTPLTDLAPLQGMPLTWFICPGARISDLTPLSASPLEALGVNNTGITDLSPLRGLPLKYLNFGITKVSDLSPLKGMALTDLNCSRTPVNDLGPLVGMPLTRLICNQSEITDYSPLQGLPLTEIECDFDPARDTEILRSISTLKRINGQTAAEFWSSR